VPYSDVITIDNPTSHWALEEGTSIGTLVRDSHILDTAGIGKTTQLSGVQPLVTLVDPLSAAPIGSVWTFENISDNPASILRRSSNDYGVTWPISTGAGGFAGPHSDGEVLTQLIDDDYLAGKTTTTIRAFLYCTATGTQNVRTALYTDNAGEPDTLIAASTARALSQANMPGGALFTPAYIPFTIPTPATLPARFHAMIQFGTTNGVFRLGVHNESGSLAGRFGSGMLFASGAPADLTGLTSYSSQPSYLHVEVGPEPPTVSGSVVELQPGQTGTLTKTGTTTYTLSIVAPAPETPTITWHHNQVYWGARLDGQIYHDVYATAGTTDAPWCISDTPPNAVTLAEAHSGGKLLNQMNWGFLGAGWPNLGFDTAAANLAWNHGSFSYYGGGYHLDGLYDIMHNTPTAWDYIGTWADQVKTWGHPILFRPIWEMNGDWGPGAGYWWQTTYGLTPDEYRVVWRNLWQIIADVMSGEEWGSGLGTHTGNISMYWCSHIITTFGNSNDPTPWFPGNKYVDWVGWDGYAYSWEAYKSPATIYNGVHDVIHGLAPNKPMFIGEFGVAGDISAPGKDAWFTDFFDNWLPAHPQVKGISYYNEDYGSTLPLPMFEQPEAARAVWAAKIANSKFTNPVNSTTFPNGKIPLPGGVA